MFEKLPETSIAQMHPSLVMAALFCAAVAAVILLWFLVRRPAMDWNVRFALLAGLGIFPIGTALLGNAANLIHTQKRGFCGSCHVMTPYAQDSADPGSVTLASRHARNTYFGGESCYNCHQDYGMYGTVYTKIGGLRHVWEYYTEYKDYTFEEASAKMHLYEPFTNRNCTACHSMQVPGWRKRREHEQLLPELEVSKVSCLGRGCHGPAHPFTKTPYPEADAGAPILTPPAEVTP